MRPLAHGFAAAALLGLTLTACSTGDGTARFDAQAGDRPPTCLVHQTGKPGKDYTDRDRADTVKVLTVLRYYVASGGKPYCDGKGPTEADKAWARLYLQLGAEPEKVRRIVG